MATRLRPTPFQTVGPFFPPGLRPPEMADLTRLAPDGDRVGGPLIHLSGRITGQGGDPVDNAVVEIWQADAAGRFAHPANPGDGPADANFRGFGRGWTGGDGKYAFLSVMPGAYRMPGAANVWRAPHINLTIFASGIMRRLLTVVFFPDQELNEADPVLSSLSDPAQRARLIAQPTAHPDAPAEAAAYRLDIVVQGAGETPFFRE